MSSILQSSNQQGTKHPRKASSKSVLHDIQYLNTMDLNKAQATDSVPAIPHEHQTRYPLPHRQSDAQISSSNIGGPSAQNISPTPKIADPTLSAALRSRQSSLQDLVAKFSQQTDEVPPLPRKASRSPSRTSMRGRQSPGSLAHAGASQARTTGYRSRSGPTSNPYASDALSNKSPPPRYHTYHQRRGRQPDQIDRSANSRSRRVLKVDQMPHHHPHRLHTEPLSPEIMDLRPEIAALPRQPLFGEVLTSRHVLQTDLLTAAARRHRRGSEGSLSSPSPLVMDPAYLNGDYSSSTVPGAWYYATAPPLHEIKANGSIPESPSNLHRRTRSDFHGIAPDTSRDISSQADLDNPRLPSQYHAHIQMAQTRHQNRHPITISNQFKASGNLTHDGDIQTELSSNSSLHSSEAPSTSLLSRAQAPPMPLNLSPRHSRQRSVQDSHGSTRKSPLLTAFITPAQPQKSPPLRSSRPRRPVSNQSPPILDMTSKEPIERLDLVHNKVRSSRPPCQQVVDFAERREKIQRAFSKTVKEEEEKEIRRASMARRSQSMDSYGIIQANNGLNSPHKLRLATALESDTPPELSLAIDTTFLSEQSVLGLSYDDSPTLGTFEAHEAHDSKLQVRPEIEPKSANTTGTNDSSGTLFEDELQATAVSSSASATLMSRTSTHHSFQHQTRNSSPNHPNQSDSFDSAGDSESIHIMLSDTPTHDKLSFDEHLETKAHFSSRNSGKSRSDDKSRRPLVRHREDIALDRRYEPDESFSADSLEGDKSALAAWSPVSSTISPKTARTTMDSDRTTNMTYAIGHHPDQPFVPDRLSYVDSRKHSSRDPRKKAYESSVGRESAPTNLAMVQTRTTSTNFGYPGSGVANFSHRRDNSTAKSTDLDADGNLKTTRASLSRPEDFLDISPSMGGFYEQAACTPIEELPPQPPEKDGAFDRKLRQADGKFSQQQNFSEEPQLPELDFGNDLAIKVESTSSIIPGSYSRNYKAPPPQLNSFTEPIQKSQSQRSHKDAAMIAPPTIPNNPSEEHVRTPSPERKRLTRRRHIIKELVDTEHSFCQDMKVVDDIYRGTSNVIIISNEDVKTLFGNSDQIVAFSSNFLDALKQAAKPVYVLSKSKRWKSNRTAESKAVTDDGPAFANQDTDEGKDRKTTVGRTFDVHMSNMERVYGDYLKNHDAANQKLQQLQKNPKVQIWLRECKAYASDLTSAWDLDSLLVKPVQRILKYPLLLDQLLEVTPVNHPDYTTLDEAAREMKGVSMRINEMKKRADIMEQVANTARKRKDSDMRTGLAKAFKRRAEGLRQQVAVSTGGMFEDKVYSATSEKFAEHFVRLQVVMRDVEMYMGDVEIFVKKFLDFAVAIEAHIEVGQTSYPELESKWRKFRMSIRELSAFALADHIDQVRRHVVQPMTTLVKLHEGPQRLMQRRDKRLPDYARYKAIIDRGDKADKKTTELGEQFLAVNETLKDELPKLFTLTGKLVGRCLCNFVHVQYKWLKLWKLKLKQAIDIPSAAQDDGGIHEDMKRLVTAFVRDAIFFESQLGALGVCNGSLLSETPSMMQFASPVSSTSTAMLGDGMFSPMTTVSSYATDSLAGGSFVTETASTSVTDHRNRTRASSSISGNHMTPRSYSTNNMHGYGQHNSSPNTQLMSSIGASSGHTRAITDPPVGLRVNDESGRNSNRQSNDSFASIARHASGYAHYATYGGPPSTDVSPDKRASCTTGIFSSAMPMEDQGVGISRIGYQSQGFQQDSGAGLVDSVYVHSAPPLEPSINSGLSGSYRKEFNVLFLAASVYEFNIDRARKEAGYPYLTYVAGEIFDVIGEKGELWLAKNQDDAGYLIGWIWNKHFVKLAG